MGAVNITCKKCGWVHFAVSRQCAEQQVAEFNAYFDTLPPEKQQSCYGGKKSSVKRYESCWCGSKEFRPSEESDCPVGVTIGPIIWEVP